MRTSLVALLVAVGLLGAPALAVASEIGAVAAVDVSQQAQPPAAPSGDIDVNIDSDGAWYASPVWIAIGVIALVIIIALIAMSGRGSTTVVK